MIIVFRTSMVFKHTQSDQHLRGTYCLGLEGTRVKKVLPPSAGILERETQGV